MDIQHLSYEDLTALAARVNNEITQRRREQEQQILEEIRSRAAALGLSADALMQKLGSGSGHVRGGYKVAAQFRDPASGTTWSGRGRKPLWVQAWLDSGRPLDELRITH